MFFAGHGLSADDKNYLLGIEMEDSIVTTASGVKRNGTKPDAEGSERVPGTGWIAAELVYLHLGLLPGDPPVSKGLDAGTRNTRWSDSNAQSGWNDDYVRV